MFKSGNDLAGSGRAEVLYNLVAVIAMDLEGVWRSGGVSALLQVIFNSAYPSQQMLKPYYEMLCQKSRARLSLDLIPASRPPRPLAATLFSLERLLSILRDHGFGLTMLGVSKTKGALRCFATVLRTMLF